MGVLGFFCIMNLFCSLSFLKAEMSEGNPNSFTRLTINVTKPN